MFLKKIRPLLISIMFIGITVLFYSNFSLSTDYKFISNNYKIESGYINNISSNTTIELYKKYFDIKNYTLKIEAKHEYIENGSKTLLLDKNNKLIATLTNVVKGDIVSNGIINNEDITKFEEYLTINYPLEDYQIKCLDINDDNEITNEDLILLKSAISEGLKNISIKEEKINLLTNEQYRIIANTEPNYGINTNLKWTSNNNDIVTINEAGQVTAHNLGSTTIIVEDINNTIKKEIPITVDNSIKLSNNEGISFVNNQELEITIRAIDYKDIDCISSNPKIATCRIDNNKLYIKSLSKGNSIITVISSKYGEVKYNLTSYTNYLDFIPEYHCMPVNKREIINLEYIYNNLEIINNNLTNNTHFKNNQFYIESLNNPDREELIITDNNNNTKQMIIDIYKLNIPSIGAFIKKGTTTSANIVSQNTESLTCTTPNNNIATCYIENNKLYVTGINKGEITLKITNTNRYNNKEYECGKTTFLAVITN